MSTQLQHREVTTADQSQAPQGKRILMLTHEFPPMFGGVGRYSSELARAAFELGHDVTVVAPDNGEACRETDRKNYAFPVIRFPGSVYSKRQLIPMLWRTVSRMREDFDIIHALDWPHAVTLGFINRFRRIPFFATAYGTELKSIPGSLHGRLLTRGNPFAEASRIFAISSFTQALLHETCPGIESSRVTVTPLGVSRSWFDPPEDTASIRNKLCIPDDCRIVLTVSRLDPRKGHRQVIAALQSLQEGIRQEVVYVIVGTGDPGYEQELRNLASRSKVRVLFTGNVSDGDVRALYAAASVFCMPGEPHPEKVEGFGLAYLESGAQNLPSIGSELGAVPEVVEDGITGIIVPSGNTRALASALARLLGDELYRAQLGRRAYQKALQSTWVRTAIDTYGDVK